MKFSYQYDDDSPLVEVTLPSDLVLGEILEQFQGFLYAAGFRPNGIIDVVEEYKDSRDSIVDRISTFKEKEV